MMKVVEEAAENDDFGRMLWLFAVRQWRGLTQDGVEFVPRLENKGDEIGTVDAVIVWDFDDDRLVLAVL
jgi:hypothetical protein